MAGKTEMTPIAIEIEHRIIHLCDPGTEWVQGFPTWEQQSCLVYDGKREESPDGSTRYFSFPVFTREAGNWLDDFCASATSADFEYPFRGVTMLTFNDDVATSKEEIIWLLQDALEQAIEEEV